MYFNIETKRLKLRPISLKDAEFIIDLTNSKGWLNFIGNRNISTKEDAVNYIQKIINNANFYYTVFELKESQKAIGIVTFLKREDEQFPDIGFALLPEFQKNGYTLEASKSYLEKIASLQIHQNIIAFTMPNNQRAIKLLHKLGFHHTGNFMEKKENLSYYSL